MSDAYTGEIRIFAGTYAPHNWAFCNGDLIDIASHTALFSILGITYGGDGRTTFRLPDLRDRTPMHPGHGPGLSYRRIGEKGGTLETPLNETQIPAHSHQMVANSEEATTQNPENAVIAKTRGRTKLKVFASESPQSIAMHPNAVELSGESASHLNAQPSLSVNFIICLEGIYPSRS